MRKANKTMRLNAIAAVIAAMGWGATHAAIVNWTGASGTWNTIASWSPMFPGVADDVVINVSGVQTITHNTATDTVNSISITGDEILTVSGGVLNAGILNNTGTGSVNVSGGTFGIASGSSGTMNLTGGITALSGTLNLTGIVTVNGGTIQGGTVQESGSNGLQFGNNGNNFLNGVTVNGVLNVASQSGGVGIVRVGAGGLTVNTQAGVTGGVVNVGTTAASSGSTIGFIGNTSFDNGTINLGSATSTANISLDGTGTVMLGSSAAVQGRGNFGQLQFLGGTENLINNGLISANINGQTLTINNSGTFTNNSTLQAVSGGILSISPGGLWSNAGIIKVVDRFPAERIQSCIRPTRS